MASLQKLLLSAPIVRVLLALLVLIVSTRESEAKKIFIPRYSFKIDEQALPKDPLLEALPGTAKLPSILNEELALVPQLMFMTPLDKKLEFFKAQEEMAHVLAKINHLNKKERDGFLKIYLAKRDDLRGLPFRMSDDCKTDEKQAFLFGRAVAFVQLALQTSHETLLEEHVKSQPKDASQKELDAALKKMDDNARSKQFWLDLSAKTFAVWLKENAPAVQQSPDAIDRAVVAALMQMITPRHEAYKTGMVRYLTTIKQPDATASLVKLAIYPPEANVRTAAIDALKSRPYSDYSNAVMAGFRYPLPVISKRAADVLVQTKNTSVLDDLVTVLTEPDPRAPRTRNVDGQHVSVVREMVRINHHHNCLMCHAPSNTPDVPQGVLTAPVALPSDALPSAVHGYGSGLSPDIFVRTDMTYLRQDFSVMMNVENAKPWPEMQRFDFFVRTRDVTPAQAAEATKLLATQTPSNHAAAQYALRELTGQTPTNPSPSSWRKIIAAR